jgi:4-carboxymuconolactone decarboxylase
MTDSATIDRFAKGMKRRREIMGDTYVERAESKKNDFDKPYQRLITESAWGHVWARDDIEPRERSMIVLGILAALGRWEEFELHIRTTANTGATPEDIREVLLHVAIYGGVPAANSAMRIAKETLAEMGKI